MWLYERRCTVCRAGAEGGETQNRVVVDEILVDLPNISRFFEMLCQGSGTIRKSADGTGQSSTGNEVQTVATCEDVSGCLVARKISRRRGD